MSWAITYKKYRLFLAAKRENRNLLNLNIKNFKKLKFKDYYINHKKFMNIIEANEIDGLL